MRLEWNIKKYADLKMRYFNSFSPAVYAAFPDIDFFARKSKESPSESSRGALTGVKRDGSLFDEGFLMLDMDMDEIKDVKVWRKDIWHMKL